MKIFTKLTISFMIIALLVLSVGYLSAVQARKFLVDSIGSEAVSVADRILHSVSEIINFRMEEMELYFKNKMIIEVMEESNIKFSNMENRQEYVNQMDRQWVSTPENQLSSFMEEIIDSVLSKNLI